MVQPFPQYSRSLTNDLLHRAAEEGWAIGQFNAENLEFAQAIARASRSEKAPVIVSASAKTLDYIRPSIFVAMIRMTFADTGAPTVLHLDHGDSFELAKRCVDAGFDSVMIDGSMLTFEENVEMTREVVEYAHAADVFVEGELGRIGGKEEDLTNDVDIHTSTEEAVKFVNETGVDSLAIAVGTSHGAQKYEGDVKLAIDRIEEIREAISIPLVLHGASGIDPDDVATVNRFGGNVQGTSGLPDAAIRQAIKAGISKMVITTDLRLAFLGGLREALSVHPDWIDPRKYLGKARREVERITAEKMRLLRASGKA